jgi:hypothetical protein
MQNFFHRFVFLSVVFLSIGGCSKNPIKTAPDVSTPFVLEVRVPPISEFCDMFSTCDIYLVILKNQKIIHVTEIDKNTNIRSKIDLKLNVEMLEQDAIKIQIYDRDTSVFNMLVDDIESLGLSNKFEKDKDDLLDEFMISAQNFEGTLEGKFSKAILVVKMTKKEA